MPITRYRRNMNVKNLRKNLIHEYLQVNSARGESNAYTVHGFCSSKYALGKFGFKPSAHVTYMINKLKRLSDVAVIKNARGRAAYVRRRNEDLPLLNEANSSALVPAPQKREASKEFIEELRSVMLSAEITSRYLREAYDYFTKPEGDQS